MITPHIFTTFVALVPMVAATVCAAQEVPRLPRSTPEEQGVSSAAILSFIEAAEQKVDALHSFMLVRHGHVVAEGWWTPFGAQEPHLLYSLSKSFTSTAIGLAISEGRLSLDDPILKFFPDKTPVVPSKNLEQMRVRDLLRMCSGQRADDIKDFPYYSKVDLVRMFLELPVLDIPGTHFVYNTPGSLVLSAIVQKVTGQTTLDYLRPRLFAPLGITNPTWEATSDGISMGGFGLSLRTEDIACFGQLYLQKGVWHGKQVVPESWVEAATSLQTANGSDPTSDWNQGYGYQFWRCRHGFYRGDGAYGQFCIVMPQYDAVLAITSGTGDMPSVMNLAWDKILPGFSPSGLAPDAESDRRLESKLASLSLPTQSGEASSPMAARAAGRTYVFPENSLKIESVEFSPSKEGDGARLVFRIAGSDRNVACGWRAWEKSETSLVPDKPGPVASSGAWSSEDTYSAIVIRYLTPSSAAYDLRFSGDQVILETLEHVDNQTPVRVRIVGTAAR